jgi:hypothetical protein
MAGSMSFWPAVSRLPAAKHLGIFVGLGGNDFFFNYGCLGLGHWVLFRAMIRFTILCTRGHEFESWFESGEAFDIQAKAGFVLCPICQSREVTKAIMAPAIASRSPAPEPHPSAQNPSQAKVALLDRRDHETRAMIADFRKHVFEVAEDVGKRFAEEARRIHYRLGPERPIHGQASFEDAHALIEEGVAILPVPPLPDKYN